MFPNRVGKPMNADNLYRHDFKPLLEKAGLSRLHIPLPVAYVREAALVQEHSPEDCPRKCWGTLRSRRR